MRHFFHLSFYLTTYFLSNYTLPPLGLASHFKILTNFVFLNPHKSVRAYKGYTSNYHLGLSSKISSSSPYF